MDEWNASFERCCNFLLEMMEKYGIEVLKEIEAEKESNIEENSIENSNFSES